MAHRKLADRIVRAVTEPLWQRDKLQMRIAGALLSAIEPKRRRPRPRTAAKNRKRSGKGSR
jgi:hypothetical protein